MLLTIKKLVCVLLSFLMVSCASGRMAQELNQGKNNFEAGDFKVAFRQLLPLASEGNKEAQYAVGYMVLLWLWCFPRYGFGYFLD